MIKRYVTAFLVLVTFIALCIFGAFHFFGPSLILEPPRTTVSQVFHSPGKAVFEDIHIRSKDDLLLDGYWMHTTNPTAVVILVHGIGSHKEQFLNFSRELAEQGIESVAFDIRAHGRSQGDYVTYGYHEKYDISSIIDYIKSRSPLTKVGVFGNSLGGAVSLQAMAIDKRIKFGIIESTFADLEQIVFDYQRNMTDGYGLQSLTNYALHRAGKIADFNPREVKPMESAKSIDQPVLLIHGSDDKRISLDNAHMIFNSLATKDKELYVVDGGSHTNLGRAGGLSYHNKIDAFLKRQIME